MNKVKIITDSCSDLSKELLDKYNIDYAKMNTVLDGETSPAVLEWTAEDVHAFYEIMRSGKRLTTTQVPVDEYQQLFTKYLDQGYDIVYIACSSKQSGSVNTAAVVANKLMETYKDNKIFCIDSLNSSFSEGILAIEASKFASMDKSAEEVAEWVMTHKKTIHEFCTVHSLDALHRAVRVKDSAAFFGNLLGVKPIIVSDYNGEQAAFKKVKGRANSIREIVMLLKDALLNSENQTIYVSHADCSQEEVDQIVSIIKKEIPCKDICIGYIGPIIGASIGPDAIAVYGFGKPVTFNKGE